MSCLYPVYGNCIIFTVQTKEKLKALGYNVSDLEELLLALVEKGNGGVVQEIANLQRQISDIYDGNIPANARLFGLKTGSVDAAKINTRTVDYSVSGDRLTYDFSKIKTALPAEAQYLSARVEVVDETGKKTSAAGLSGVINAPSLPATLHFSMDLKTKNGILTLNNTARVSGDVEHSTLLNINDYTVSDSNLTIREYSEALAAELVQLKSKI